MNLEKLLEMLEIDEPEEFEYYENFADLVECDEEIPEDVLFKLFSQTDQNAVADIINNYFEEMLEAVPDDSTDFYTLIENIRLSLTGLIKSGDDENAMVHFSEELDKFKKWYSFESAVECKNLKDDEEKVLPLRDALTLARLEKLEGDEYSYDFSDCMDYEIEDYIMDFADLAKSQEYDGDSDALLDNGYLYDDEMKD